jgi:hypothetical protein
VLVREHDRLDPVAEPEFREQGVDLFAGQSANFTVTVHHPGTYYLGEMTGRPHFTPIRVTGGRAANRHDLALSAIPVGETLRQVPGCEISMTLPELSLMNATR